MSMLTSVPSARNGAIPDDYIWRLSVQQYHEMIRSRILTEDDPVELLEGWLVIKMPKNPPHRVSTELTRDVLGAAAPPGWHVDAQEPITTQDSEPEPDVAVIRGERRQYLNRHPQAADVGMLVEVSDASLHRDRTSKKRVYAAARVPVYWIVNLPERQVEVFSDPSGAGDEADYRQPHIYGPADELPFILDGVEIARIRVADLLP